MLAQLFKSPLKRWLILGLVVLSAHLGLLQSMPLSLNDPADNSAALPFITRTITPEVAPKPEAPKVVVAPQEAPKPRPAPRPVPPPPAPAVAQAPAPQPVTPVTTPVDAIAPATPASDPPEPPEPAASLAAPVEIAPQFNPEALTRSIKLLYKVNSSKSRFTADGELNWRNNGTSYQARMGYSAFGFSRSQTSVGNIAELGLKPNRFADKNRNEVAAHFVHVEGKVVFSANTPDVALKSGAQDRLSILVQLGALIGSNLTKFAPGSTLSFQTVGPRSAETWVFALEGNETLDLPGGQLDTLRLVRQPREPYDQRVEVWLAPALGYLPARIRISEANGEWLDQKWYGTAEPDPEE